MARKKAVSTTTIIETPVCNTWYEPTSPPPPENVWCLLHVVDTSGGTTINMGKWHPVLKVWLDTGNVAIEASDSILGYSPVFDANGNLWRCSE